MGKLAPRTSQIYATGRWFGKWMTILFVFLGIILSLSYLFFTMRSGFKTLRDVLQFNIGGGGPMARLVPNVSYLLLFIMFLSLSL